MKKNGVLFIAFALVFLALCFTQCQKKDTSCNMSIKCYLSQNGVDIDTIAPYTWLYFDVSNYLHGPIDSTITIKDTIGYIVDTIDYQTEVTDIIDYIDSIPLPGGEFAYDTTYRVDTVGVILDTVDYTVVDKTVNVCKIDTLLIPKDSLPSYYQDYFLNGRDCFFHHQADAKGVFNFSYHHPALFVLKAVKFDTIYENGAISEIKKYTGTVQVQVNEGETTEKILLLKPAQ